MKRWICVLGAVLMLSAHAQDPKAAVNVYAQCENDSVGTRIAYFVKESIRKSSAYRIEEEYPKAGYQISIVCLRPGANDAGVLSIFSYSYVALNFRPKGYYDYHITHGVYRCGSNRVEGCAQDIVASFDKDVGEMRARISRGEFDPF